MKIFEELKARGLVKQVTDAEKVRRLLNEGSPIDFYIGFDPTAKSLHVGHLLQVITARRLVDAGHRALLLIGSATAMIGDPTGKSQMRQEKPAHEVLHNAIDINDQLLKLMGVPYNTRTVFIPTNLDWLGEVNWLEMLQEVGRHFSVNTMLRAECFKSRMETGLSFLEFNYMIMQAIDFLRLHERRNCILQIGGDDQWSNMLAGVELIHKKLGKEVFAMTLPLLTTSNGVKMGKTEKGTVWLSEEGPTSIFDFFQFWRNIPDTEVLKCFKMLTFLSLEEIAALPFSNATEINAAKKRLAFELTRFVHGESAAAVTLEMAEALFEGQDTSVMEPLSIDDGTHILDMLKTCGFAKSRTDARNLIGNRGITINEEVWTDPTTIIDRSQFGSNLVIRKGKKHFRLLHLSKKGSDVTT